MSQLTSRLWKGSEKHTQRYRVEVYNIHQKDDRRMIRSRYLQDIERVDEAGTHDTNFGSFFH